MDILYYILLPIVAYIGIILLGALMPIIISPITAIITKFEKKPNEDTEDITHYFLRFRVDMLISGIFAGFTLVFLVLLIIDKLDINIKTWYIITVFSLLSIIHIILIKTGNPISYELSLNISPIIGYIIGFIIFL